MKRLCVEPLTDDERNQLRLVLKHSTPADRIALMEAMRLSFGTDHLKRCRDLKFRMQDAENRLNPPPVNDR